MGKDALIIFLAVLSLAWSTYAMHSDIVWKKRFHELNRNWFEYMERLNLQWTRECQKKMDETKKGEKTV